MSDQNAPPDTRVAPAPTTPKVTLQAVILKVKFIAKDQYEDKVYDNILSIYNQLETIEKRVLLKGLISLCFIVEDKLLVENVTMNEVKTVVKEAQDSIHSDIVDIEKINKIELIKLKSWMVKAGSVTLLGTLVGVLLLIVFLNQDGSEGILANFEFLKTIGEVLKTAFGL